MDALRLARLLMQIPEENSDNYDYSGYSNAHGVPAPFNTLQDYQAVTGAHLGDEYKTPGHITFSDGSRYAQSDIPGGIWQRGGSEASNLWNFQPSATNLKQYSPNQLADYFRNRETSTTTLTLPDGRIVRGSQ